MRVTRFLAFIGAAALCACTLLVPLDSYIEGSGNHTTDGAEAASLDAPAEGDAADARPFCSDPPPGWFCSDFDFVTDPGPNWGWNQFVSSPFIDAGLDDTIALSPRRSFALTFGPGVPEAGAFSGLFDSVHIPRAGTYTVEATSQVRVDPLGAGGPSINGGRGSAFLVGIEIGDSIDAGGGGAKGKFQIWLRLTGGSVLDLYETFPSGGGNATQVTPSLAASTWTAVRMRVSVDPSGTTVCRAYVNDIDITPGGLTLQGKPIMPAGDMTFLYRLGGFAAAPLAWTVRYDNVLVTQ